eukprot:GAHX01009064.1.p1 GENE.GAHX01009064.1~~GAHX01009064.1.p1  ORF type:complete len:58 (-),score=5.07 GAHX01009064.1:29-202(-)
MNSTNLHIPNDIHYAVLGEKNLNMYINYEGKLLKCVKIMKSSNIVTVMNLKDILTPL